MPKNWHEILAKLTPCHFQPQIPTVTSSDPVHVIVYQNDGQQQQQQQQQQPISYKIPQLGVVSQEQVNFPPNLAILGILRILGEEVKKYS